MMMIFSLIIFCIDHGKLTLVILRGLFSVLCVVLLLCLLGQALQPSSRSIRAAQAKLEESDQEEYPERRHFRE